MQVRDDSPSFPLFLQMGFISQDASRLSLPAMFLIPGCDISFDLPFWLIAHHHLCCKGKHFILDALNDTSHQLTYVPHVVAQLSNPLKTLPNANQWFLMKLSLHRTYIPLVLTLQKWRVSASTPPRNTDAFWYVFIAAAFPMTNVHFHLTRLTERWKAMLSPLSSWKLAQTSSL
jgi:hypothetical protein